MTNFERWKETITADDLIQMSILDHQRTHRFYAFYCPKCPAYSFCETYDSDDSCRVMFRKWASQEANCI
jgi:hypothetical protein